MEKTGLCEGWVQSGLERWLGDVTGSQHTWLGSPTVVLISGSPTPFPRAHVVFCSSQSPVGLTESQWKEVKVE